MDSARRRLGRVGDLLRGWRGRGLAATGTPGLVDTLLSELARPAAAEVHQRLLRRCLELPDGSPGWRRLTERGQTVVACLAREWVGPDFGQVPALQDANMAVFADYTALLCRLGAAALPAARRLLAGPSAPVNTFGYEGTTHTAFGPKISALALVRLHGDSGDCALLEGLVRRQHEDDRVRVEAALVWSRWQPREAAAAATERCLAGRSSSAAFGRNVAPRLALLGVDLVPAVLAGLGGAEPEVVERAVAVLELVGPPAVPLMVEFCRDSPDSTAWIAVEGVLAKLDHHAYRAARGFHTGVCRGLSRVISRPDPARGVTRAARP